MLIYKHHFAYMQNKHAITETYKEIYTCKIDKNTKLTDWEKKNSIQDLCRK